MRLMRGNDLRLGDDVMSRMSVALVLGVLLAFGPATEDAQATDATTQPDHYAGLFVGDRLSVDVKPEADGRGYVGVIRQGRREFPFTAAADWQQLRGRFASGSDSFEFIATVDHDQLTLETGGATYVMTRRVAEVAPVVARPTTNKLPTSLPAPTKAVPAISVAVSAPPLESAAVFDAMMGCDAATLRVPQGWKSNVEIVWRPNPFDPAVIAGSVSEPGGPRRLAIYPRLSFIDKIPAAVTGQAGSYMGSEVRKPSGSPADYVRAIILPRFRTDVAEPRFVGETDLPAFARDQIPKFQKLPGVRVNAAAVRIAYELRGNPVEEEFVCTLGTVPLPDGTVAWGAECVSYRAALGEFKSALPLLRETESSLSLDLQWYGGVFEISQKMQADTNGNDAIGAARLTQYVSQRSNEISDVARGSYARRQQVIAAGNKDLDAALGVVVDGTGNPPSQGASSTGATYASPAE